MMLTASRWIQLRESQTFWDDYTDIDVEFDSRRFDYAKFNSMKNREKKKEYLLPIDIRVQLGLFRLNMKNSKEALNHFQFLLEFSVSEVSDLYHKVGTELESSGLYEEALQFLGPLSEDAQEYNTIELIMIIARCLRETEDFESAKAAYQWLLEREPDNLEIKVNLAEVCFYLNELDTTSRFMLEHKKKKTKMTHFRKETRH
ncbi:unnamed protein product [Ambrosiozyma monospora]|uniref:Unnamed protein product n=1 Tax=Ambrosiozyma monospora TaxID=43982 RepID=A0ACB5U7V4_AMBMO|nr:unnamed protein product [Ambrosiozyma monospora]